MAGQLACRLSGGIRPLSARAAFATGAAVVGLSAAVIIVAQRGRQTKTVAPRQDQEVKAQVSPNAPVSELPSLPASPAKANSMPGLPPADPLPGKPKPRPIPGLRPATGQLPALASRPVARPIQPGSGERCTRCGTGSGKGSWYRIEGRSYCPNCAPPAARKAGVDLAGARPTTPAAVPPANDLKPIPGLPAGGVPGLRQRPNYLPPERRVPLQFNPAPVRVNVGHSLDGKPAWYVVSQSYVAIRDNGQDTGLAITPAVSIGPLQKDGTQAVTEDTNQWLITHIPSGKTLGQRAFSSLENAQQLATILAQLDWTREENQISDEEVSQVTRTFHYYSQALRQEQQCRPAAVKVPDGAGSLAPAQPAAMPTGSLAGLLIADNVGGVARVLEDKGEILFVADSFGQRYEIGRDEARVPQEEDFKLGMLAMPIDPARHKNSVCGQCGADAATAIGSGQSWYRMDLQPYCPGCAVAYAHDNGYELPETIGGAA